MIEDNWASKEIIVVKKTSGGKQGGGGRFRSAISGGFVSEEYAKKNPSTTVHEAKPRDPKPPRKPK